MQAEKQIQELTTELQKVEDDLDASESRLADVTLQLEQAEQQMDENERCYSLFVVLTLILQIATTSPNKCMFNTSMNKPALNILFS